MTEYKKPDDRKTWAEEKQSFNRSPSFFYV